MRDQHPRIVRERQNCLCREFVFAKGAQDAEHADCTKTGTEHHLNPGKEHPPRAVLPKTALRNPESAAIMK